MTRLAEILFAVNCEVFRAIDETLTVELGVDRKLWIRDEHLPRLIPAIEAATMAAMRDAGVWVPGEEQIVEQKQALIDKAVQAARNSDETMQ